MKKSIIFLLALIPLLSFGQEYKLGFSKIQTVSYADTVDLEIKASREVVKIALTGNMVVNVGTDSRVQKGHKLTLKLSSDSSGTRKVTLGTGFAEGIIYGIKYKTRTIEFVYDGVEFSPVSVINAPFTETVTYADTITLLPKSSMYIATITQTDASLINLDSTFTPNLADEVVLKLISSGGSRTTTFGDNFTGPALVGDSAKTHVVTFIFDGTDFIQKGSSVKIN